MSKKTYKVPKQPVSSGQPKGSGMALKPLIDHRFLPLILAGLLVVIVSLIYFPVAFQGKAPLASDITQWQGAAKSIIDYNNEHSDNALWTPNMFSGMPSYMISFPNRYPFLESLTKLTDKVINWRIFLLIIGGLGIFVLLRFLKLDPWLAFMGAIAFVFSCHWIGLVEIGHNTKFRAIMYVPWVIWSLFRLRDKCDLLGMGLMASFLITQLRENHPQISYYLYLFVGMYWIYALIEAFTGKDWKKFGLFTGLLILSFGLTILAVMNPYLSNMEYSHYTMRGGQAGLDKAYAQSWSFHPLEIIGFIIPDFFGGINDNYWGFMPFTQIYNYFGIVILAFGFFALMGKHRRFAIFLWLSSAVFTIMSFGEFAPGISDLLLRFLPYFNKFRVPSMILTMTQILAVILAALGVDTIISEVEQGNRSKVTNVLWKVFWLCGGLFVAWLLLSKIMFKGLPFVNASTIDQLKQAGMQDLPVQYKMQRLDLLVKSGNLSLLFLTVSIGLAYLYSAQKLGKTLLLSLLTFVIFVDLWIYTGKHLKDVDVIDNHQRRFVMTDFDQFLLADKSQYRIYPFNMGKIRMNGEWAYYHQTIDGYSAAKLKRYDDILKIVNGDQARGTQGEFVRYLLGLGNLGKELPTPVLDMLSTKYIIYSDSLPGTQYLTKLDEVFSGARNVHVFRNNTALPKAWFVEKQRLVENPDSVLALVQRAAFDPATEALVESSEAVVPSIDSIGVKSVREVSHSIHKLEYQVKSDKDSYLVLSEVYYPAGWKAYLDGEELPIFATNYILRGVQIPAGEHKLELVFAPESYQKSLVLSIVGLMMAGLSLVVGLILERKKRLTPSS